MSRRKEDLEPLHGEVVERPVPEARPVPGKSGIEFPGRLLRVPFRDADRPLVIVLPPDRLVEDEPPPEQGIRWDRLAAYAFGIVMLLVVLGILIAGGVLDLSALSPDVVQSHRPPPDLVHPSR
jgi:hypothetical protein